MTFLVGLTQQESLFVDWCGLLGIAERSETLFVAWDGFGAGLRLLW
jgi:hypothetical protein